MLVISVLSLLLLALLAFRIRENLQAGIVQKRKRNGFSAGVNAQQTEQKAYRGRQSRNRRGSKQSGRREDELSPEKSLQIFSQIMEIIETEKLYLSPELDRKIYSQAA
jgi:hypothetical protein